MTVKFTSSGEVNVKGVALRYLCEGSGLPALVIGSAIYYPRIFSRQLRKSLRLIFMDVRHFAKRAAVPDLDKLSLETYLDDIEQVRAQLELDRVVLIGHSHHGNLALEYAKKYPMRVSHVVLIGSPPVNVSATVKAAQMYWTSHASEERKSTLKARRSAARAEQLTDQITPEQAYVSDYVADGPKYWFDMNYDAAALWQGVPVNMELIAVFRSFFSDNYELAWDPEKLTAPILVMMGEYDYAVPPTLWTDEQKARTNLTFHLFEHSSHTPPLEEPAAFERVLLNWLKVASQEEKCSDVHSHQAGQ